MDLSDPNATTNNDDRAAHFQKELRLLINHLGSLEGDDLVFARNLLASVATFITEQQQQERRSDSYIRELRKKLGFNY